MTDYSDSAMIALMPSEEDAQRLAVDGYEKPEDMHVTLVFLGDASALSEHLPDLHNLAQSVAQSADGPMSLTPWATAHFNPDDKPCAVYLIGGENGDALDTLAEATQSGARDAYPDLPEQHSPYVPHMTAGYGLDPSALDQVGQPVTFDRVRLAVGDDNFDYPLGSSPVVAETAAGQYLRQDLEDRLHSLETLLARGGKVREVIQNIADGFNEALHPRGKDGRFIETNGAVSGTFRKADNSTFASRDAKVIGFKSAGASADDPFVLVEVNGPDGKPVRGIAKASEVTTSIVKARLDQTNAPAAPDAPDVNAPNVPDTNTPDAPAPPAAERKPRVSAGAKVKTLDASAADYGLNYQEKYVNDPDLAAAKEFTGWDNIPTEQVDPHELVAVEDKLSSSSIAKVTSGAVPLREGYVVRVVEKPDGTQIIVDGHHRAAMSSEMDQPLDVKIVKAADLPKVTEGGTDQKTELTPDAIATAQNKPGDAVEVEDTEEAINLLAAGVKIHLSSPEQVTVLLDRMKEMVDDAIAKGDKAPIYDLCNVTVTGTNLFCAESKNIARVKMPQLLGPPLPGSKADALPKDSRGEVDLSGPFRAMLESRGTKVTDTRQAAVNLRASQSELNGGKTAGIARAIETGHYDEVPLFVSNDGYIVDGHHRWSATLGVDLRDGHPGDLEMPTSVIDMDILDILDEANKFAEEWGIPQASVGDTKEVDPNKPVSPDLQLPSKFADHPLEDRVNKIMKSAEDTEPQTTPLLVNVAAQHGGHMEGLDFKFKKPDGVLEKFQRQVKATRVHPDRLSVDDALRYTMVYDAKDYTEGVNATIKELQDKGFTVDKVKNGWEPGDAYNGINMTFSDPKTGAVIELQFHTPESKAAVADTHKDYELVRSGKGSLAERKKAFDRMVKAADAAQTPGGVLGIGSLVSRPFQDTGGGAKVGPSSVPTPDAAAALTPTPDAAPVAPSAP